MHYRSFETLDMAMLIDKKVSEKDTITMLNDFLSQPWFYAIKMGSEVEGNSLEELSLIRKTFPDAVLRFKIGGCGAKNDVKKSFELGIDYITLPMAETSYALGNFFDVYKEYKQQTEQGIVNAKKIPLCALNVESISLVNILPKVKPLLKSFSSITIGRSDLSGSIRKDINSPDVDKIVSKILSFFAINFPNKQISIGGKITPSSVIRLYAKFGRHLHFINTKHVYIEPSDNCVEEVKHALVFETMLYYFFYLNNMRNEKELYSFIENNRERILH